MSVQHILSSDAIRGNLQLTYDALPEQEKNSPVGTAMKWLLSGGASIWTCFSHLTQANSFHTRKQELNNIINLLNLNTANTKEAIKEALRLENSEINSIFWITEEHRDRLLNYAQLDAEGRIENADAIKKSIIDQMTKTQTQFANDLMESSVKCNLVVIVVQVIKLYCVWQEISSAANLVRDPHKFQQIEQGVAELRSKLIEAQNMMDENKAEIVQRLCREMTRTYNKTIGLVNKLEVKINNMEQKLMLYQQQQVFDGISNTTMTISSGIQLLTLFSSLNTGLKIAGTLVTAAFAFLTAANVVTYMVTKDRIQEIRAELAKVTAFADELDALSDSLDDIDDWLKQMGK